MKVCHGQCNCPNIDWIKPLNRILDHYTKYGPEICPDCHITIDWISEEE
jgi:hypothetical protein